VDQRTFLSTSIASPSWTVSYFPSEEKSLSVDRVSHTYTTVQRAINASHSFSAD